MMLAALGETRQAIEAANSLSIINSNWSRGSCLRRSLEACGRIPASFALAARMGLIKYWRETGKRPDFCTGPTARSECSPQLLAALKS